MKISEMNEAVEQARRDLFISDDTIKAMASLLVGRLKSVSEKSYKYCSDLAKLKKELEGFNMTTKRFKE